MKMIRIVTKVERTPAASLSGMARVTDGEVTLPAGIQWEELKTKPHAVLTVTDKVEDKAVVWTAKLVMKTCQDFDVRQRYAYRCRLIDGSCRLVGTGERPWTVATVQETMPEGVAENQLNEVTVTWQTPRPVPYIRE